MDRYGIVGFEAEAGFLEAGPGPPAFLLPSGEPAGARKNPMRLQWREPMGTMRWA